MSSASPHSVEKVVVHPIVLLSAVDHYNRLAKDTRRRVVGVLLGEQFKGRVDVVNSFAVPFEEDRKDASVWYLDKDYLERMTAMFLKVAAREKIVGFYSTGPHIRPADLAMDAMFRKYCSEPVLVVIDVRPGVEDIPIKAYRSEELVKDGKETQRTFAHVPAEVGAFEVEQVGVEHLLRDVNDPSVSSLAEDIRSKVIALRGLKQRLQSMSAYMDDVVAGKLPINNQITYNMQAIFNLLPNLNLERLARSMIAKTNDMHLAMYIAALIRSISALHDLVNNKVKYRDLHEGEPEDAGKAGEETDKGAAEGKGAGADSSASKPSGK